jgi:hypothetical protein
VRTLRIGGLVGLGIVALAFVFAHPPRRVDRDFNAFYCAAKILASGGDPYHYQPVYTCQVEHLRPIVPNAAVPAPLPPYGLAAFVPMTKLPFLQASLLWDLTIVLSTVTVAVAVIELTGLPPLLVAVCVIPTVFLQSLANSGLAPVPIALLSASAVAIVRSRPTLAAVLMGLACVEPNVALPPLIAAFLFLPAMRARLAVVAIVLAALSLAAGRLSLNAEYFLAVLPAHAASELGTGVQYSLSSVLSSLGFSDRAALTAGSLQYALFVLAALWLVRALAREAAAVVLVPMALAVSGGTYIHLSQLWGVLPLALYAASRRPSIVAWLGVGLLAVPWEFMEAFVTSPPLIAVAPVPASALTEVGWRELAGQYLATPLSWLSHILTYAGVVCVFWGVVTMAFFLPPRGASVNTQRQA